MITLKVDNQAHLYPASGLPGSVLNQIEARLTFPNPAHQEAEKRGFSTWNITEKIKGFSIDGDRLTTPRGFIRQLVGILRGTGIQFQIEDHRRTLAPVDFTFTGQLHDFQVEAVEAMAGRDFGTLAAPTGSGKTVMALALIAKRRHPALVVVHTRELQDQWLARIETFLVSRPARWGASAAGSRSSVTRSPWPWCNRCTNAPQRLPLSSGI
jgi:SNF2 family DNA or RNA helicase